MSNTTLDLGRLVRGLTGMQRVALKHTLEGTDPIFRSRAEYGGFAVARRALLRKKLVAYKHGRFSATQLGREAHAHSTSRRNQ